MIEIAGVVPGGRADGLGILQGDRLISINGRTIDDVIDYRFSCGDERLTLVIEGSTGTRRKIVLNNHDHEDPGIVCPPLRITRCRNRCIFCFVDQMPPGCRRTLYVKDDDFRASFLYGNYITLSALSSEDVERIARQRLSPLYISVHATDDGLRSFMLGNKKAPDILDRLRTLADQGIRMHTQIVLCPGINDGSQLRKTVSDLAALFPSVLSIAVVPVGLTAFREGLYPLKPFSKIQARSVLSETAPLGRSFKKKFGTSLVFPSDELYLRAGMPIPGTGWYEEFPQLENGVGMVRTFLDDAGKTRLPKKSVPCRAAVVTGRSFGGLMRTSLLKFRSLPGLNVHTVVAQNLFFGKTVTVAGLLTGSDIARALQSKKRFDLILIPSTTLKDDEDIFLDGMSLHELQQQLGVPVRPAGSFREMVDILTGGE